MAPGRGGHRGGGGTQPRSVMVSKALSRLLRHAAVQERIPIDNHGYVRMDHLLGWQRLRSMKPSVQFDEVVDCVGDNEKKRFALKYASPTSGSTENVVRESTIESDTTQPEPESEKQSETETQRAIAQFEATPSQDLDAKQFFIRATQGHSMKTIEAENLLTPITLDDPGSVPDTVVHGTFYGAWDEILRSGGLKSMARNHVHFAGGPSLQEVLPAGVIASLKSPDKDNTHADVNGSKHDGDANVAAVTEKLGALLGKNKVISGMRSDAQILIYIDIQRALAEEPGMKWWRSENGVILTDGIAINRATEEQEGGERMSEAGKIVPVKYFLAAVEVKEGVGLLFKAASGVMKDLPERLRGRSMPRGKGGGPRGGRGGRGRG